MAGHTNSHLKDAVESVQTEAPREFTTALFNFTVDFELFWGNGNLGGQGHSQQKRVEAARAQAENFAPFVEMLVELRFPISWAVLGIIAEPRADIPREKRFAPAWEKSDWYAIPEGLDRSLWSGESYLKTLREELPFSEILSHGYGHIDYSDPSVSKEIAKADIEASSAALAKAGMKPAGFVFPCNQVAFADAVFESGYRIARGADLAWQLERSRILTPKGFWISPGCMSLRDARSVLREGIRNRSFVHPWMHLIECDLKCDDINEFYRPLFESVLEAEAKRELLNISFGRIAENLA